ncbi:MAG: acyl-CoA dehydratase activase [Deltaproteobacteria bacterium]|nr:acyl-CoA dehydratase activase [Deltaproteobacteria bacterium]
MRQEIVGLGVDAGSTTTKLVGVDGRGERIFDRIEPTRPQLQLQVKGLLAVARASGAKEGTPVVATGYGRKLVEDADKRVTEITCHARGVFRSVHHGGTLIDIGGQDAKAIRFDDKGAVQDFAMNDKCAAGTGRFLEVVAGRLGHDLDEFAHLAANAGETTAISSTCTVFAESEIISLIAQGETIEAIARGLHTSLMGRIAALARSVTVTPPLLLSGGVARSPAAQRYLGEALGLPVEVPEGPQLMGAYGAALMALDIADGRG